MSSDSREKLIAELAQARSQVRELEERLAALNAGEKWQAKGFYASYYATTGFLLGLLGALASLLFNVVGSVLWSAVTGQSQHVLRLIQVYLTFPMGESALEIDSGLTLAVGCSLYILTGMIYGVVFQMGLAKFTADASLKRRLIVASGFALVLWLVNFYVLLRYLQPLLLDGNWIVELVPWWVAALTHLVFGWTMALVYPWGEYIPYRTQSEAQ